MMYSIVSKGCTIVFTPCVKLWKGIDFLCVTPFLLIIYQQKVTKINYEIRGWASCLSVEVTAGRNLNTCHATAWFLAALGPHPRPDCGEAQIPGGWAVQLESTKNEQEITNFCTNRKRNEAPRRKVMRVFPLGSANRGNPHCFAPCRFVSLAFVRKLIQFLLIFGGF